MVGYINAPANSILSLDDSTKINAIGNVNLDAVSENYIASINGGITIGNGGGKSFGAASTNDNYALAIAAGGAVAYADIGTSDNKEVVNAKMTTVAVCVGGSAGNGTRQTRLIKKNLRGSKS